MAMRADDGALRDDLVIPQGSYWPHSWPITGPADLAGWTVRALIRTAPKGLVLFEWNTAVVSPSATLGIASATGLTVGIALAGDQDSALWAFVTGVYDVVLRDPSNKPTRVVGGSVRITPSVTY